MRTCVLRRRVGFPVLSLAPSGGLRNCLDLGGGIVSTFLLRTDNYRFARFLTTAAKGITLRRTLVLVTGNEIADDPPQRMGTAVIAASNRDCPGSRTDLQAVHLGGARPLAFGVWGSPFQEGCHGSDHQKSAAASPMGHIALEQDFAQQPVLVAAAVGLPRDGDRVTLRGTVPSYYLKQVAQTLALRAVGAGHVQSDIDVQDS